MAHEIKDAIPEGLNKDIYRNIALECCSATSFLIVNVPEFVSSIDICAQHAFSTKAALNCVNSDPYLAACSAACYAGAALKDKTVILEIIKRNIDA